MLDSKGGSKVGSLFIRCAVWAVGAWADGLVFGFKAGWADGMAGLTYCWTATSIGVLASGINPIGPSRG